MASSVCNRHSIQNPEGNGITGLQIIYLFSYIFWSNPSDTETASSVPPEASQSEDSFLTFHRRLFHQQIFFFAASHFLWLACLFQQILVSFKSNVNEKGNSVFDHKVSEAASLQLLPGTERPKQLCTHQDIWTWERQSRSKRPRDTSPVHLQPHTYNSTISYPCREVRRWQWEIAACGRSVCSLHNIPVPV